MKDYNRVLNSYSINSQKNKFFFTKKSNIPIYLIFQLAILFILMFLLILQNVRYQAIEKEIYEQVKQKRKLEENILPLKLEVRNLTRNEILEKFAEEKFFLKAARKDQIIQVEYIE